MHFKKTLVWIRIKIHRKLAPDPDVTLKEKTYEFWLLKEDLGPDPEWIRIRQNLNPDLIIPDLQNIDLH